LYHAPAGNCGRAAGIRHTGLAGRGAISGACEETPAGTALGKEIDMSRLATVLVLLLLPASAAAEPDPGPGRWGIGFHLSGLGLASEAAPDESFELGGAGIQVRYRLAPRWEFELAVSRVRGERERDGLERDLRLGTLGVAFHLTPKSPWDVSLTAGFGGGREDVSAPAGKAMQPAAAAFAHAHAYVGVGLERRFRRWGLGGELRAVGLARDPDELDGPAFAGADVPVPEESSGAQLRLAATYFF
jgi:hypothetical protein